MSRVKKLMSIVSATVLSGMCMLNNMTIANAVSDSGKFGLPEAPVVGSEEYLEYLEHYGELEEYTLEQLLKMDNQEFLQLEGAQDFYDDICDDISNIEYGGISGAVEAIVEKEDMNVKYTANETEMKLENLLGKNIEYYIGSPIKSDFELSIMLGYFEGFQVAFPECEKRSAYDIISDEDVIQFAKCCYCVNQIIPIDYKETLVPGFPSFAQEKILKGDLNFDRVVNIADVAHFKKLNVGFYDITELQIYVGDLDNNEEADAADILVLIESLLGNYELI